MKLTQNKIDEVILDILGTEGLRLVKELKNKDNISEFSLASKLNRDIKLIRHMLYKLYNYNLVSSTRKKDKQKGWYIYYWTIIPENIKFLYLKNKNILLQQLKEKLEKENTEHFYACPKKCVRLDFDQALDFEFRCPECGELISQDQDHSYLKELEKQITRLEKEISSEEPTKRIIKKLTKQKATTKKITKKKLIKKTTKKKTTKLKQKLAKKKVVKKKPVKKKISKKPTKKTTKKKTKK